MNNKKKSDWKILWRNHRDTWLFVAYTIMVLVALLLATMDLLLIEAKIENPNVAHEIQDAQELYARWRWGFDTADFSPRQDDDEFSARRRLGCDVASGPNAAEKSTVDCSLAKTKRPSSGPNQIGNSGPR